MIRKKLFCLLFILLLCLAVSALADVSIDEEHFPDPVFRLFVRLKYDADGNSVLSDAERSSVTIMNCSGSELKTMEGMPEEWSRTGISSLQGIEYFPALTSLNCSSRKRAWPDTGMTTLAVSSSFFP